MEVASGPPSRTWLHARLWAGPLHGPLELRWSYVGVCARTRPTELGVSFFRRRPHSHAADAPHTGQPHGPKRPPTADTRRPHQTTGTGEFEPWLSSCRAVEALSRRCRGAVEALPVEPVELLSSLSSLTPCACGRVLSRSVEVCRGLLRSVEQQAVEQC